VTIAMQSGGALQVDVPLAHSFATGSPGPKPALVAVLDRVAESMRRQPATRVQVAAATDPGAPATLALTRAQRVRDHLVSRRIAASRIAVQSATITGSGVQLLIVPVAAPVARLDDASLPVPTGAVKPVTSKRATSGPPAR
jgi:hypothetical protein